jgi:hypothetical protein
VDITEEVDVVRVCNVVNDEGACYELFIVGVVSLIAVRVVAMCVIRVGFVGVSILGVVDLVAVVRIAMFIAMSMVVVLDVLCVRIMLVSLAVVLSQKRCSGEDEQGGEQGLD